MKKLGATQIRSIRNAAIVYEFALSDLQADASKPKAPVAVLLDGKSIGKIIPPKWDGNEGYQYVTKNYFKGDQFPTLRECQKSLESGDD